MIKDLGFAKDHNPKSKEIYDFIADLDFKEGRDFFCFKSGGDGDNGELLMDYLDAYFESKQNQSNPQWYYYLGVLEEYPDRGILLRSPWSPQIIEDKLASDELTETDFPYFGSTNWNGNDNIGRMLELKGFVIDKKFSKESKKTLVFRGFDEEIGHKRPWDVRVKKIFTLRKEINNDLV